MGAAAYNRGSRVIAREASADQSSSETVLLRDLTEYSAINSTGSLLFAPTVARIAEDGRIWLMNRRDRGWGEYGIPFRTAWELAARYPLIFVGIGRDDCSAFYEVMPGKADAS